MNEKTLKMIDEKLEAIIEKVYLDDVASIVRNKVITDFLNNETWREKMNERIANEFTRRVLVQAEKELDDEKSLMFDSVSKVVYAKVREIDCSITEAIESFNEDIQEKVKNILEEKIKSIEDIRKYEESVKLDVC